MLTLFSDISATSETVSNTCDIALAEGNEVMIAMAARVGDQALTFTPMPHHVAG